MFVGWEGVGLCSYLLIGFWFEKKSAADAGKKAFIVNRIGDFGFLLGMFLHLRDASARSTSRAWHDRALAALRAEPALLGVAVAHRAAALRRRDRQERADPAVRLAARRDGGPDAGLGADPRGDDGHGRRLHGRAAQRRSSSHAPTAMAIVAIVGALTALFAATIGLAQNDIKRVLAYSTVSQLGFMFLGVRRRARSRAGIFHLSRTPSSRRCSSSAPARSSTRMAGEQDMRKMGGLRSTMPITYWTFLMATARHRRASRLRRVLLQGRDPLAGVSSLGGHVCVVWLVGLVDGAADRVLHVPPGVLTFDGERRAERRSTRITCTSRRPT